ncbi:Multiprotein bridging factor 1B [Hibiscus syriacus]|uniref:Multiprotein bridging factor 1B n=1 Tax=Hibiscus syriacus TaxID=106335 RepID=A0A6A2YHY6_HIBSY|nr:uncharacterized protein LOC120160598 [Hibiscus syriacus]KAE8680106.1 Multiprotein bridging factor 1B [Hibiscus syriacus]
MNPYDEKRLRDEVIYLHNLWHQGPPQSTNQTPQKRPGPSTQNPTNRRKFAHSGSYPPPKPDPGLDWSALMKPSSPPSPGWPEPKSKPDPTTVRPVSVEDQARFASMQMQNKVVESCKEFFNKRDHDEEDSDGDGDGVGDGDEEENNEFDLFLTNIFVNNSELRGYYEENHEKGEFFCLVCGGIGENLGKKFNGCVGLVQHCMSISKTKCKTGHRAFGLVVCKVLGWDCDRLPVILLKGEPLSRRLANSRESQNTLNGDASNKNVDNLETGSSDGEVQKEMSKSLDKKNDLNVISGNVESANDDGNKSVEREVFGIGQRNGELMVCENSLKGDDANKNVEGLQISDAKPNKAVDDMGSDSSQITTSEWPCIEPVNESASATLEWPSFTPCTAPVTHVVSAEEQVRINMVQFQQNVFEACTQFLSTTAESDSGEDDNEFDEDENEDDLMDEDGSKDSEEFSFFLRLFTENKGLRNYYETHYRDGDFFCLVCRGIKEKAWRTFIDCVGLIQHSTAISKTKRKRAHRAFGQVICKVLNWDIDHLPSIMLKSEPQIHPLENSSQNSLNADENVESLGISDGEPKPNKGALNDLGLDSSQITTSEWPCIEPVNESTSTTLEWSSFKLCTAPVTRMVSSEEQIRIDMVQFQQNVFEACTQFLYTTAESDSDENDNEFDEDKNEDDLMDEDGSKDGEEFSFFLRLFAENNGLRSYYETHCRDGDFFCLVCRGIGKKAWRTFKDCVGLIQHSTAISKTKRKRAHRAFGQVICKVLNWDIDHLPSTILKSEHRSHSMEDLSQKNSSEENNTT